MITAAIGMFIAMLAFASHLPPQFKRRVVGYALIVDIATFALCLTFFGGTGTERLAAIGASIGVTCALHLYRWLYGYEKLTSKGWERFSGYFTPL